MSLRDSIQVALLLAIGTIMHLIIPGYGSGMKPDLLLSMLFIILLLRKDAQSVVLAGILAGVLSALTTAFPGGQIPNVVDKLVTTAVVFFLVKVLSGRINSKFMTLVVGVIGTIVSGTAFLGSALYIVGLPAPFTVLFVSVVLPATVLNTIAVMILHPIVVFSKNTIEGTMQKA